jgi:hypothetical protein
VKTLNVERIVWAREESEAEEEEVVYGIAAIVIGLPRKESGNGGETRARRPNVMSK